MRKIPTQVATVILAGGEGTRLRPLTVNHCKPAVPYGGRYRLIDIPISNSINSDFRQIFVIAQYLSGELQHHVSQTYHFDTFNPGSVDVLTPQDTESGNKAWFDGTADAVRKNLDTILKSQADYFLILSGDQLYNIDFQEVVDFTTKLDADLCICSLSVTEEDATRMGVLKLSEDKQVEAFVEKPKTKEALKPFEKIKDGKSVYLASMGIYVFKREALVSLLRKDDRSDFGFHLIDTSLKMMKVTSYEYQGYWEDIGTITSYYDANLMLIHSNEGLDTYDEKNPIYTRPTYLPGPKIHGTNISKSIVCEGSIIEAKSIENSIIGLRSRIGEGTIIQDTVMLGNHFYMPPTSEDKPLKVDFHVGSFCHIKRAIIDEHVRIGNHVKLINKDNLEEHDGDGFFVRQGIIIVTSGASIPDHFEF